MSTDTPNTPSEDFEEAVQDIRDRIVHLLSIYPYISRAMIQVGLGPGLSPKFWDSPLQALVDEGKVRFVETVVASPSGRSGTKGIYYLPSFPYPPIKITDVE